MSTESNPELFVKLWHAASCAALRHYQRTAPATPCKRCRRPRKEHHQELRCDSYITSGNYVAANGDEVQKVEKTIALLEELAEVRGWSLCEGDAMLNQFQESPHA